ncbi:O-Methyltransferase involved in polyketide biosynthesis [Amycolatopsis arida]|uniref:O-Methyltransferase involved in polyketide biosynthesis n=1 Tax=Amycolatopsis arida TaxID=587909 RepID=A0A1I5T1J7_9PSEU|nr:SAM-dependent methyltransferase [Amycolatopsis arida]TDX96266.1 O-methyltransferase involved in polyketide biosynthesis [Amycolatopsis arida]SFP76893.1 O-Methyltransferase involved in polyketide biosynthesis [Amycolatopsis arida]
MSETDGLSSARGRALRHDMTKPSVARLYDAMLGGKDHYEVDRQVVRRLEQIAPEIRDLVREHRQWQRRVVRFLAHRIGIDQFLDLGSGLPTIENTHQVAQRNNGDARVVYVDIDPAVQAHARATLEENDRTYFLAADLTRPAELLADPVITTHLELDRPLGLLQCATLHYIPDLADARAVLAGYVDALAPGSYVVLTHQFDPGDGGPRGKLAAQLRQVYAETVGDSVFRSRADIESFFDGLDLVEPGLAYLHEWWPDGPRWRPLTDVNFTMLGGVARKP